MLSQTDDPTLLSALKRHWRLALLIVLALCVLLVVVDVMRAPRYVAKIDVLIREPAGGAGFDSERYAADQVNIMISPPVSTRAVKILATPREGSKRDPIIVEFGELMASREIVGDPFSNEVSVLYTAADPDTAVWAANSIVDAYVEVVQESSIETARTIRESFNDVLAEIERQLIEIDRGGGSADMASERASLVAQQASVLARISDLNVEAALNARPLALRPESIEVKGQSMVNARSLVALAILGLGLATALAYLIDRRAWAAMHPNGAPAATLSPSQLGSVNPMPAVGPAAVPVGAMSTGGVTAVAPHSYAAPPPAVPQTAYQPPVAAAVPASASAFAPAMSGATTGTVLTATALTANGSGGAGGNGFSSPVPAMAAPAGSERPLRLGSDVELDPTLHAIDTAGHQVIAVMSPAYADRCATAAVNLAVGAARTNHDVGYVSTLDPGALAQNFSYLNPPAPPADGSVWTIPVAGGAPVRVMNSMQSVAALVKFTRRMRSSIAGDSVGPALLVLDLSSLEFVSSGAAVAREADAAILVLPSDSDPESERVYRRFLESKGVSLLGVMQFDGPHQAVEAHAAAISVNGVRSGS